MMPNWTEEQSSAINTRNKNILVSAAAGSGKTAVLVERVIKMILDEKRPVSIDRIVVVTFTNAAASQMKEKIYNRISSELARQPENSRLLASLPLVHQAAITTIDSFCLNIIRNNFNEIDIDPSFRMVDEGEMGLMKAEVMEEMLEDFYKEGDKAFLNFVDRFSKGKNDKVIEDIILNTYSLSRSFPWPDEWLDKCVKGYEYDDINDMLSDTFFVKTVENIRSRAKNAYEDILDGFNYYKNNGDTSATGLTLRKGFEILKKECEILTGRPYDKFFENTGESIALPKGRTTGDNQMYKNMLKSLRDEFAALREKYYSRSADEIFEEIKSSGDSVKVLVSLVKDFSRRLTLRKREKNVIDFSDMEHLALDILVKRQDGVSVYSRVADELCENYEEILIDEYQDSNYVQEAIIAAISKERLNKDRHNVFMVGDVKQSIYKFRMARPEIFTEKYNTYEKIISEGLSDGDGCCEKENAKTSDEHNQNSVKIELSRNFRSRKNILESVNDIFLKIMKAPVGNVEYNDEVKLNLGRSEENYEYKDTFATEMIVIDKKETSVYDDEEEKEGFDVYTDAEGEGAVIADRIKDMVGNSEYEIYDEDEGTCRPLRYSDIVILMRSAGVSAEALLQVLNDKGIPAFYNSDTGYFSAKEIKEVLNFLSIIDNPRQDIPFAGTMLSYFGGFNPGELARIRAYSKEGSMYETVLKYCSMGSDVKLAKKCTGFFQMLNGFRKKASYTGVSDLVSEIVYSSGYYAYMELCGNEKVRKSNLDILVEKSKNYEKTSYVGLFNFLRYIEKLKKYDVDYSNTTVIGENDNLVRIMTIHKSKGLEFPVVFVAGLGKRHNKSDARNTFVIDADYGIGTDCVDLKRRVKRESFYKTVIKDKINEDMIGEELRVLYVALTRAKEKLILVGTVKDLSKKKWDVPYTYNKEDLKKSNSFLDMIVPVIMENTCGYFKYTAENTVMFDKHRMAHKAETLIYNYVDIKYPYRQDTVLKSKYSVSEIKHMAMEELDCMYDYSEKKKKIPEFAGNVSEEKVGALRGTAYHKVMELLDYDRTETLSEIISQMSEMPVPDIAMVTAQDVYDFCHSDVGERIKHAYDSGKLYRERQFVFGDTASNLNVGDSDEMVLIQGIIDMFFIENDEIVLLDYKTDRIKNKEKGIEELTEKYREQLILYKNALEQILRKPVKEMYIYSFELKCYILLHKC